MDLYLKNRFDQIVEELKHRRFNINTTDIKFSIEDFPTELQNDWIPTLEEQEIIRERIQQKINMKPNWYKKTKYRK